MITVVAFIIIIYYLFAYPLNEAIKKYLFLSLIVILPLVNNFFLPLKISIVTLTAQRTLLLPIIILIPLLIKNKKIFPSNLVYSIVLFILYYSLRGAIYNEFPQTIFLETIFSLLAFIVIENLSYNEKDRKIIPWYFAVLAIFSAYVSYKQLTGDGQYYRGGALEVNKDVVINAFEDVTRNPSVFGLFEDGMLFIGLLSIIFIFKYFKTKKLIFLFLYVIVFLTAFFTFDRSTLIAPIVALMAYVFVRNKDRLNAPLALILSIGSILLLSYIFINQFSNTAMYQERFLSKSYETRTQTLDIFFNHLIDQNIVFGFGSEQHPESFQKYGRGLGGSLNGFIGVYVYGGLVALLLYLNIFRIMFKRINAYRKKSNDYEFFIFPISFILYNFTLNVAYFFYWPSFLLFWMYFRIHEQLNLNSYREKINNLNQHN